MRGVVKEVPSGDTLVVSAGAGKPGAAEKRITLASVVAPKLGRRDGTTRDEPFAWQSREFLRKLCVGKPCVFRVDYTLEQAGGKEFGTVFINEKENVAATLLAAGWAKVRTPGGSQSPFYDDLAKAAGDAEARSLGVHTKDKDAAAAAVRDLLSADEFDGQGLVARVGKGKQVEAIVEAVNSGSTLRVTLLPDLQSATVMVAGVQCPSMGRRPPPTAAAAPAAAAEGEAPAPAATGPAPGSAASLVASGTPAAADAGPEPFAREARYFTEVRTLNKEVQITLQGVSQFGVLVGSVQFPPPPGAPAPAAGANGAAAAPSADNDLASALVKAGLARTAEWGLNMMTTGSFRLRELERSAKQGKVGMWHNYVPQTGNSAKLSDKFTGVVAEVVSGDCLIIKDKASGVERRVNLSSIRAPRMGTRERAPEPWAVEAKEFLRQRLIGKEVTVSMEYNRKVQPLEGGRPGDAREMAFATVTITEGSGAEQKANNVAEMLLIRGLAQVIKHRADEERSAHYEDLMNAETQGKQGKKGQWSSKEPPKPHVNDVSLPGTSSRAKQHLPFLQRAGKVSAVCEYVLSGHRVKLHIPKEGVTIAFNPSGVRCPQRGQPATAGRPAVEEEPYWEEALQFTREHVLQRDVEVEVSSVDRAGNFQGTLRVGKLNLGVALLEAGLAKLHPAFDPYSTPGGRELEAAQSKARAAKLKVWEKDEPEAAAEAEDEAAGSSANGGAPGTRDAMEVVVSDVTDANGLYVQVADEPRVMWVAEQLAGLNIGEMPTPTAPLKAGEKCLAQSSADKQWYRASVEKAYAADPTAPKYDVLFMDFGNKEHVTGAQVRPMPQTLAAVPGQAHQACLAFIKAPSVDAEHGVDAAQYLWQLVGGNRRLTGHVERRERLAGAGKSWGAQAPTKLHLTLIEPGSDDYKQSVNGQLLAAGLARLVEPKGPQSPETAKVLEALRACQDEARRKHVGIYEFGDVDSEEEDDGGFPALGGKPGARGGRR